ncbi:MAG: type II toxin-antitoxin system RelB/DinJ family antitoxin [Firmicutes bacterium]|nr:type II toxin-antitoxin system RelB/DinJ family antitoxin [Bacillota bacterium]
MASMIQVRVDDELKIKSDALFRALGTDTTSAIRIFLAQAVANNGFPFEIKRRENISELYKPLSEEEMMAVLDIAREHSKQGKYRGAAEMLSDLK